MAHFNLTTLDNCITLGDTVKEYKRLQEEFIPTFTDTVAELRHTDPDCKLESLINRIMAETIADMETARDLFRRSDKYHAENFPDQGESYVRRMGVI